MIMEGTHTKKIQKIKNYCRLINTKSSDNLKCEFGRCHNDPLSRRLEYIQIIKNQHSLNTQWMDHDKKTMAEMYMEEDNDKMSKIIRNQFSLQQCLYP